MDNNNTFINKLMIILLSFAIVVDIICAAKFKEAEFFVMAVIFTVVLAVNICLLIKKKRKTKKNN